MRVNAASLHIRAAITSTSGTLNDLTTDLIMANNNNLLQGSRMVSHLSGSPLLTSGGFLLGCDQTENESLVPSIWFVPF